MKELIDVFSSNQLLILGIVIFIFGLILLGYLLTLILVSKRKDRKSEVSKVESKVTTEITEQKVEKNVEEINDEEINNELEQVLNKMQRTLDEKEELDHIESFEREQEENAIISYQELLKAAKKDFPQMDLNSEKDSRQESKPLVAKEEIIAPTPVFNKEPIEPQNKVDILDNVREDIRKSPTLEETKGDKKFKSSIFISPIGVTNNENPNYYKEVRIRRDYLKEMTDSRFNTVDIQTDELDYEKKQNEQFLEDLKNFRSNL